MSRLLDRNGNPNLKDEWRYITLSYNYKQEQSTDTMMDDSFKGT